MSNTLSKEKDLLDPLKVFRFIGKNGFSVLGKDKLISLEIFPKRTLSGNKLILYRLTISAGKKKIQKNVWGKTCSRGQAGLIKALLASSARSLTPVYFGYLKQLKFFFSEGIEGGSLRSFEKDFSFLQKNVAKVGAMLADFQAVKIAQGVLKNHSRAAEEKFLENSLAAIRRYSHVTAAEFEKVAGDYSGKIFSGCWNEKTFCFAHFDFQASNILYSKSKKRFCLLDYDLAEKFSPANDVANFWVHLYVMSRYHFSKSRTLYLCDKFLAAYLKKAKFKKEVEKCFGVLAKRTVLDIGKITASVFQKPSKESEAVFEKLQEILKIIG